LAVAVRVGAGVGVGVGADVSVGANVAVGAAVGVFVGAGVTVGGRGGAVGSLPEQLASRIKLTKMISIILRIGLLLYGCVGHRSTSVTHGRRSKHKGE